MKRCATLLCLCAGCLWLSTPASGQLRVDRVSSPDPNVVSQVRAGSSGGVSLSADGSVVAFVSGADDLVTNDSNGLMLDVFVRDRVAGFTRLVSATPDDSGSGDGDSFGAVVSDDGTLVFFESKARNLVTNITRGVGDLFARNLVDGRTTLLSRSQNGLEGGNGSSRSLLLTPDARFAVFESAASNLVSNDINGSTDIFLHDLQSRATTLVSQSWQGGRSAVNVAVLRGPAGSAAASVTPDGRFVAFQSAAWDLVQGVITSASSPAFPQVYARDMDRGTNILVSIAADGRLPGNGLSLNPRISADGRYVVFQSHARNLISPPPQGSGALIYRRDLRSGATVYVTAIQGATAFEPLEFAMSGDGRYVAYCYNNHIYLWDGDAGHAAIASSGPNGPAAGGIVDTPLLTPDGARLFFVSSATNLTPLAAWGMFQLYERDLVTGVTRLASADPAELAAWDADVLFPAISASGRVIAFDAWDNQRTAGDTNQAMDVFVIEKGGPPPAPRISIQLIAPGGFPVVTWRGSPNHTYRLEWKDRLRAPGDPWDDLPGSAQILEGSQMRWEDPGGLDTDARYYRLRVQ